MIKHKGLSFLLLLCLTSRALSLSCPRCNPKDCPKPSSLGCTAGVVDDICGCCKACAKDLGESCKGPFGSSGVCGTGLDCYINEAQYANIPGGLFNANGVCIVRGATPPECDANGEPSFCAFDLVPTCGSNGVTYQGSCEFASAKCKNPGLEKISCGLPPVRNDCDPNGEPTFCAFDLAIVCDSNGVTHQGSCSFASAKCKNPRLEKVPCGSTQLDCPSICRANYAPVCGSDGKTYSNACALTAARCRHPTHSIATAYEGECDAEPTCAAAGSECAGGFCKERCDYANGEFNAPFNSCGGKDCTCCASPATSKCFGRGNPCEAVVGGTCRDQCEFGEVEQGFCTARVADVAQCVCCRRQNNNPREFTLDAETFIVLSEHKGSTWKQAQNHCQREGNYKLAEPALDVTRLASYLNTNYGAELYWLGTNPNKISTNSPLWRFNANEGLRRTSGFCMYIRDNGNPNPLGTYNCQDTQYMTPLCERTGGAPPPPPPPAAPAAPAITFPGK